jgi:hypothetical protein
MRSLAAVGIIWMAALLASPAHSDPLSTLDQFCGGAVSSPGCVQTIGEFPLETGAVVAIIEAEKSHFSSANDCKVKLGIGQALYNEVAPYLGGAGVDVGKVINIAYSTSTCSGEAEAIANKAADEISKLLTALDGIFGIDDSTNQKTQEQIYEDYYVSTYKVVELKLIDVSDDDYLHTRSHLFDQCYADWSDSPLGNLAVDLCNKFNARFVSEVDAARAKYKAYVAGQQKVAADKLQAAKDKLQAEKDAATTNARKTAMNWAQIKHNTYSPQCHDTACLEAILVLSFAYYGQMATGMQDLNAPNTQVLIKTNQQFDPLFKGEIAKDTQRLLNRAAIANQTLAMFKSRPESVRAVQLQARQRLRALGVLNPDSVIRRAFQQHVSGRPYRVTTERLRVISRPVEQ